MRDWKTVRLEEYLTFRNGKKSPEREPSGCFPVYGSNGIIGFCSMNNTSANTITIGRVGAYCGSVYFSSVPSWVTDNAIIAEPYSPEEARFWYYVLSWLNLNTYTHGSAQPLINQTILRNITIKIPCKEKRLAIAEVLSSLDDQIELLTKQNETLKQFSSLIFEKECKTLTKVTLSSVCDIVMGSSPKGSTYNSEQTGLPLIQGVGGFGNLTPVTEIYTSDPKRVAESFDILFSVRAPVGDLNIANQRVCIGRGVAAIQHEKPYLLYFALINAVNEYAKYNNEGTIYGSINRDDLRNIRIVNLCLPEKPEQILRDSFEKLILNDDSIQKLRRTRDALIPQLMSGALRVTDAKRVIPEEVSHA